MQYITVAAARSMNGLRLVLSAGVPGPWGEAAKAILNARNVPFAAVSQQPMAANPELREWTGRRNAPIAVYNEEPPCLGWYDILMLAERLGTGPSLLPAQSADRALCVGFSMELCGQDGFGWQRRLNILAKVAGTEPAAGAEPHQREIFQNYGMNKAAVERAAGRTADILLALTSQLKSQRAQGSRYLVGATLTALDLYWACFSQMCSPMAPEDSPMPDYLRAFYADVPDKVAAALDPILIEHRDDIFRRHIGLPMEF